MNELDEIRKNPKTRRHFLATMGAAGLGAAAVMLLDMPGIDPLRRASAARVDNTGAKYFPGIPGANINVVVVNFALTLEFLEADLYRQALNQASGHPLTDPLLPFANRANYTLAVPSGNLANTHFTDAQLTGAGFRYLVDFAYVEAAHRDFLVALQGSAGVTANAAGYKFPGGLGNDLKSILTSIYPLEETGVRAYLGALPYCTDLTTYATTAATIYSTEARHSAALAYTLSKDAGPTPMPGDQKLVAAYPAGNTFEYYLAPATVLSAAAAYFNT